MEAEDDSTETSGEAATVEQEPKGSDSRKLKQKLPRILTLDIITKT